MIIDAHSHWLPAQIIENAHFYHKGWGDIEAQVKMMRESGIDKAVLSYPTSDAHHKLGTQGEVARIFNDAVANILRKYPDTFIGAAVMPVGDAAVMLDEAKRATEKMGFRAISLATSYDGVYLDDAQFTPLFKFCRQMRLPVFVHAQIVNPIGSDRVKDPLLTPVIEYVFETTMCVGRLLMSDILRESEGLNFVFGYFGGVTPFLAHRYDATYRMLRGINFVKDLQADPTQFLKRIYVDTSGDTTRANLEAALALFGPEHILWGSDWPAKKDGAGSMDAIRGLAIPEEGKAGILGENALRLFQGGQE
jgi:predicted TIM-barrel fold metal-dependent hydrolase